MSLFNITVNLTNNCSIGYNMVVLSIMDARKQGLSEIDIEKFTEECTDVKFYNKLDILNIIKKWFKVDNNSIVSHKLFL
jgi:hypothetical protein